MPINTATSEIGNGVISLPWQLRCHCNPDHNKFSSLSNTTVVLIFPNLCLWRRSVRSNVGGIHSKKLYRATLSQNVTHQIRVVKKYQDFYHCGRWLHRHNSRGFHVPFYSVKQSLTLKSWFLHVLKAIAFKRQEPFFRHWLQNETGLHTFKRVTIIIVKSQSAWDVQSHNWHVKVLDFAPFRCSYVREFELSHSNLVNRIRKITHAHNLHVKMLIFGPFTIRT